MEVAVAFSLVAIVLSIASWVGYRLLDKKLDLDRINDHMERQGAILDRMELATFVVAADLADAKSDIDAARARADEVTSGEPGEAADAHAKSAGKEISETA